MVRGYELFKENQCASCHWTGQSGGRQGPNLARLTAPPNYVRNSLINPDSQVDFRYQRVQIMLPDDSQITGRRLHENSYFMLIMDGQEQLRAVDKRQVKDIIRTGHSLMPSFSDKLSPQDVEDLTSYVYTLNKETAK